MRVLGISPLDKDATISFLENGKVLFAAGEERFTRHKRQDGFPVAALEAGFKHTGFDPKDIAVVAYPFFDWEEETAFFTQNMQEERLFLEEIPFAPSRQRLQTALAEVPKRTQAIPGLGDPNEKMGGPLLRKIVYRLAGLEGRVLRNVAKQHSKKWGLKYTKNHKKFQKELKGHLLELGLFEKLQRYDHHLSHAANAYFASGFDRALVITFDDYGSGLTGSACIGEGSHIYRIHEITYPHSLGIFYESVTSALGCKIGHHEDEIVDLAAYGNPQILLAIVLERFTQESGSFCLRESNNLYFSRYLAELFPKIDVASAYQRALELVATYYVRHYVEQTGIDTVVLSGGVTANVKMNQRIFEIPGVRRIFVYPNMGDGGCGTGAAFLASQDHLEHREAYHSVYFGPEYSEKDLAKAIQDAGLAFEHARPIEPVIAKLLHDGHLVARFHGRMEYGPRALGNRSILYQSTVPEVKQWLNQRLRRTEFMSFAPATLFAERHRCYQRIDGAEYAAQFMTMTFDCTDFMKRMSPVAVHIDGTTRPQLVHEEVNPSFHKVIQEYYQLSGIPSVINSSFNMPEEPIVNSPDDAIRSFLSGNLDYLAIGDFLIKHPHPMAMTSRRA